MSLCTTGKALTFLHRWSVDGMGRIAVYTAKGCCDYRMRLLVRERHPLLDLEDMPGLSNAHAYGLLMGIVLPLYIRALHGFCGIACFHLVEPSQ